jgi:signal peptidase II
MKNSRIFWFCVSIVAFIGCDSFTKHLAKVHLMYHQPISYLHNTVILEYVENTGAALSLGDDLPKGVSFWLLSIVPLVLLLFLLAYVIMHISELSKLKIFAFALIIAGGIGNIIDRIFFDRHVTDFMNVGFGNVRTGIFNFADMCVTAGVIAFLLSYREKPKVVEVE